MPPCAARHGAYEMDVDNKLLLDIRETARILSLGRSSVYKLLAENRLHSVKIGDRRLITRASVAALVSEAA